MLTYVPAWPSTHLHQQALLRVHQLCLGAGDAKQRGVEGVHTAQEAAMAYTQLGLAILQGG